MHDLMPPTYVRLWADEKGPFVSRFGCFCGAGASVFGYFVSGLRTATIKLRLLDRQATGQPPWPPLGDGEVTW
jgi:hypothetical protein